MFDQCLRALACTVRAYNPQQSVEIRVGKRGNQYKSCTNSAAWMGLLAYSLVSIYTNCCLCVCYCRCHLFHLQLLCLVFPDHGTPIHRLLVAIRSSHGFPTSPLRRRRWSWSFRGAKHGGCNICPQQRHRWKEHCSGRRGVERLGGDGSAAASEHPVKAKARVKHISTARGSVRWQPDVFPRGTCGVRSSGSRLGAQQQYMGRRVRLQLQLGQLCLLQW